MFRAANIFRAPLATLKPILAESVTSQSTLRRILGVRTNRAVDVSAINSVVEKTKGEGLAGNAAVVGRALLFLRAHSPIATISEIDRVISTIQDDALKRMALGIRLRARNDLLDLKETALSVSGGATEAEVSEARAQVKADYSALKGCSPNCWLVELADAEFSLYTGEVNEAYQTLLEIEAKIKAFLDAPFIPYEDVATPENTNGYLLTAFLIQRSYNSALVKPKTGKVVEEAINAVEEVDIAATRLEGLQKHLNIKLSEAEASEIAFIFQMAYEKHHFHEFFPVTSADYAEWDSPAANLTKHIIFRVNNPSASHLAEDYIEKVRAAVPPKPFFASEQELQQVIKSVPAGQSVLAAIREKFGSGPQTPLSAADEAYHGAIDILKTSNPSQHTAGTPSFARRQGEMSKALARQMLYRTQVQIGVALTELNRLQEAVDTISPVIRSNEYIYMWRAFMARNRAYKGLGLITLADKDAKQLKALKLSLTEHAPYEKV